MNVEHHDGSRRLTGVGLISKLGKLG